MSSDQHVKAVRVAVVGTLNVDLVCRVPVLPRAGATLVADSIERQFGGKGANQAVAAARQGAYVTLIGATGDDTDGRFYRAYLEQERISTDHIAAVPEVPTGTAHVYVDRGGENTIVVNRGANQRLDAAAVQQCASAIASADIVATQLECPVEAAVEALRLAAKHSVRSILNASPTCTEFPWATHPVDTVIVNEHECAEAFGIAPAELWAFSVERRRAFLAERRINNLVITRGADATLHLAPREQHCVGTHPVQPLDTVGAGDTFAGVLAALLARGASWPQAIRTANVAAALSTLAAGAQRAMPTRAQVEAAMAGHETGAT